jgi:hypothetical protein
MTADKGVSCQTECSVEQRQGGTPGENLALLVTSGALDIVPNTRFRRRARFFAENRPISERCNRNA